MHLEPRLPLPGAFVEEAEMAIHDAAHALQSLRHETPETLAELAPYLEEMADTLAELTASARRAHRLEQAAEIAATYREYH